MSDQQELNRDTHFSRRKALKLFGLGAGAALLAGTLKNSTGSDEKGPPIFGSEAKDHPEYNVYSYKGVQVWETDFGDPARWVDASGRLGEVVLDKTVEKFAVRVDTQPSDLAEVSTTTAIPEDVVTTENLSSRGIEIISSPNVDFFIREGAFTEGGLLADYQAENNHRISIVLVDSPMLFTDAFADARYDSLRPLINDHFGSAQEQLQYMRDRALSNLKNLRNKISDADRSLRTVQINSITVKDMIQFGLYEGVAGYQIPQGSERGLPDRSVIFLAVGKRPAQLDFIVGDRTSGDWQYDISSMDPHETYGLKTPLEIRAGDSYPNPNMFKLTGDMSGIYAAVEPDTKTLGFVARHELGHDYKWTLHPSGIRAQDDHEGQTDIWALECIKAAHARYVQGDDSGYALVFRDRSTGEVVVT